MMAPLAGQVPVHARLQFSIRQAGQFTVGQPVLVAAVELADHGLRQVFQHPGMIVPRCQIIPFLGVAIHVEQLTPVPGRVIDQLPASGPIHARRPHASAQLTKDGLAPPAVHEAHAIAGFGNGDVRYRQQAWHHVGQRHKPVIHGSRRAGRVALRRHQDHRNPG